MKKLSLIVAIDKHNGIGLNGKIPWKIPLDMENFQYKTCNSIVIMGRRTWESIPKKFRPLSNRTNVIITSNLKYECEGQDVFIFHSLEECVEWLSTQENPKRFVIGGKNIYEWFFDNNFIDRLCITYLEADYGCDTVIDWDYGDWTKISVDNLDFITAENRSKLNALKGIRYEEYELK